MKSYESTYNSLDQRKPHEARAALISFLSEILPDLTSGEQPAPEIAYVITCMMSSNFAHTLKDDDPPMEIMTIAGELEITPKNTQDLTRELIEKIEVVTSI